MNHTPEALAYNYILLNGTNSLFFPWRNFTVATTGISKINKASSLGSPHSSSLHEPLPWSRKYKDTRAKQPVALQLLPQAGRVPDTHSSPSNRSTENWLGKCLLVLEMSFLLYDFSLRAQPELDQRPLTEVYCTFIVSSLKTQKQNV